MDARSEAMLAHVHLDLARVMRAAAQAPQPFVVIYGIRTLAAEEQAVATGHSQTLHSRHLPDPRFPGPDDAGGLAMAVDVGALIRGAVSFAPGQEQKVFGAIAAQVKAAARAALAAGQIRARPDGAPAIQWGGDTVGAWVDGQVSHFRDWGHFQLDPSAYA